MAPLLHYSSWTEEPGRLQSMGSLKSRTLLSNFTFTFHFHALEKEVAIHSSVFAWRIPGMGEPGGLPSRGSEKQMVRKSIRPQPSRTMGPLSSALAPLVLSHLHRPRIKGLELAEPPSFFQFSLLWLPNHPPAHHPSSCLLPRPSLSYESSLLPSYL